MLFLQGKQYHDQVVRIFKLWTCMYTLVLHRVHCPYLIFLSLMDYIYSITNLATYRHYNIVTSVTLVSFPLLQMPLLLLKMKSFP